MTFPKHDWIPAQDGHKVCEECFCSTRPKTLANSLGEGLDLSQYLTCEANKAIAEKRYKKIAEGIRLMTEAAALLNKNAS